MDILSMSFVIGFFSNAFLIYFMDCIGTVRRMCSPSMVASTGILVRNYCRRIRESNKQVACKKAPVQSRFCCQSSLTLLIILLATSY